MIIIKNYWKNEHWWVCEEIEFVSTVIPCEELLESKIYINRILSNFTSKNLTWQKYKETCT